MKLHFFTIPVHDGDAQAQALNQLLASARVVELDRRFVDDGPRSAWAICVVATAAGAPAPASQPRARIDYKEVLSPDDFERFARLRSLRKELADRDGVPPYALFNNAQLAAIVTDDLRTVAQLQALPGVGPARVTRYGEAFLAALREAGDAAP